MAAVPRSGNLDLPPIYCPIESAVHPAAKRVEERALAWIDRAGFCANDRERAWVVGSRSADFYARFAPSATEDRLLAAVRWVYWGFAFDDACCDQGPLSARTAEFVMLAALLQRTLELAPAAGGGIGPWAEALSDVGADLRRYATPVQFRRFVEAHRAWLSGVAWQIGNRALDRVPELDEYLAMRLHSAGGEPTFAMIEIVDGSEVPGAEMDSPAVRALTEMAIAVAALDNDRHSYRKESALGQTDQNVFTVLMRQEACSAAEAAELAVAVRDRVLCRFLALRERVWAGASSALRGYLAGLGHGIRGNAEWGQLVPRYTSLGEHPGRPAPAAVVVWADRPVDARPEPLPLPSVRWWWDALA